MLSISVSGVPLDATLSAGTNNGGGSWTLTPAQLVGLKLNAGETAGDAARHGDQHYDW